MKLLHLSDLHLGKRVNEFPMLEDQRYILTKIINIIDAEKPDGVLIAGDIYDKSVPPADAVELFDDFLVRLSKRNLQVFVISGNHDSAERIAFGGRLMDQSGVHMSPVFDGKVEPVYLADDFGKVAIYMLPFVKPAHVRRFYPEAEIATYTDALDTVIQDMNIKTAERNILITHQFVTGSTRSDSEDISVGGSDNVDAQVFEGFDYVALGHIHGPQNAYGDKVRYCGTPLKYSFSETSHEKSVTVVQLGDKGDLAIKNVPLEPKHDMVEIKGKYEELTLRSYYENTTYQDDYIHITLTDEEDIPDAIGKLRVIYHNLMKLDYDNQRTRQTVRIHGDKAAPSKTPYQLFADFYQLQNNQPLTEVQSKHIQGMIEQIWEGEK